MAMGRGRAHRVPFSPHPIGAYSKKGNRRIAVIALGHLCHHVFHCGEKNRIVVIRLQKASYFIILRPLVEHPLRRALARPVLGGGNAKRHLPALLEPALCRSVDNLPVEFVLFRLNETPGKTQEHGAHPGEILHYIGRLQF